MTDPTPSSDPASPPALNVPAHIRYIQSLDTRKDSLDYWLTEHLRVSGVYWGLTALHLLGCPDGLPRDETIAFIKSCQHACGGFGAAPGHDPHMLYTVSAVQILATVDALDAVDGDLVARWIAGLQNEEGVCAGDEWGETDTRFLYGAINALSLLRRLDYINRATATSYILRCRNADGGFGLSPSAESHSGQIFTCIGALRILDSLHHLSAMDLDLLGDWLCERQLPNGGLNGRPEKLEDVCYSWWVLSSLAMIDRTHWIDRDALVRFILRCQDEQGGIADRPGDAPDVFHTVFALTGLSLLKYEGLQEVDPVYCMPREVTRRILGK